MAKSHKVKDILEEFVYGERTALQDLVGKKIVINGFTRGSGEYGEFLILQLADGITVATASDAIVKVMEVAEKENLFPVEGTVQSTLSKKRKGKFYYSLK